MTRMPRRGGILCCTIVIATISWHCSQRQGPASAHLQGALKELKSGQPEQAIRSLEQAVMICDHGCIEQPADRATILLVLTELLGRQRRFAQAEAIFDSHQQWLTGVSAVYALQQRATFREWQGDVRQAQRLLLQAANLSAGKDGPFVEARRSNVSTRATLMAQVGQFRRAYDLMATAPAMDQASPCRRAVHYNSQGWIAVLARQALRRDQPLWRELDPVPSLERALREVDEGHCDAHFRASILNNLAHAAIAAEDLVTARRRLAQAQAAVPADDSLSREWADLAGQVELLSETPGPAAERHFRALEAMGRETDSYDSVFRGYIGHARVLQRMGRLPEAIDLCGKADEYLDLRILVLPLSEGRAAALGRFEAGVGLCIGLMLDAGHPADAVKLLRKARNRSLRALSLLTRLDALTAAQRRSWEAALSDYQQSRKALDRFVSDYEDETQQRPSPDDFKRERARLVQRLLERIDAALATAGEPALQTTPRAPKIGEVMLACHPRFAKGWYCFLWDRAQIVTGILDEMTPATLAGMLGQQGKATLAGARRLSVLPYGALRDIDVAALPGLPDKLAVIHVLDASWQGQAVREGNMALVIGNPDGSAPEIGLAARRMDAALRAAGWQVMLREASIVGGMAGAATQPAGAPLRELWSQAALWHYLGHMEAMEDGTLWLRVADEGGLLVSDVLTMPAVPRGALLFGCGTAHAESAGAEGLALSSALLLRGTRWIVATGRGISPRAAAVMADALYAQPRAAAALRGDAPDLSALLRQARAAALLAHPDLKNDLDAFRELRP